MIQFRQIITKTPDIKTKAWLTPGKIGIETTLMFSNIRNILLGRNIERFLRHSSIVRYRNKIKMRTSLILDSPPKNSRFIYCAPNQMPGPLGAIWSIP